MLYIMVVLKQLYGKIACRIALCDMFVGFEIFLQMFYSVFYLVTIVYVQVASNFVLALIYLNDNLAFVESVTGKSKYICIR